MQDKILQIESALERCVRARKNLNQVLRDEFPIGAEVHWKSGYGSSSGKVIRHTNDDRIRVMTHGETISHFVHAHQLLPWPIVTQYRAAQF